ncbi:hypothetical protein [Nonomuraea dietziae]|uniref:hypothetical protein n=1 Tax=Nonomuraea dietziae TaxID=65515 RepID=UPI0031DADB36
MRVFVAGGSGVGGRRLVSPLVARDGQVKPTTRNPGKPGSSETLVEVVRSRPALARRRRARRRGERHRSGPAGDVPVVRVTVDRGGPGHPSWRQGFEGGRG